MFPVSCQKGKPKEQSGWVHTLRGRAVFVASCTNVLLSLSLSQDTFVPDLE